ncbi:hypothetical protein MANES_17G018861v8 [Manihot esculenta]|uniref:Uncharacterized protein n=1 Tax=Manihot esculenta TaxID=3983 RepID=A0ACB7G3S3_MANES|nr:hypothetical protein MANES_17G018861v8 [Manihot esculenta]
MGEFSPHSRAQVSSCAPLVVFMLFLPIPQSFHEIYPRFEVLKLRSKFWELGAFGAWILHTSELEITQPSIFKRTGPEGSRRPSVLAVAESVQRLPECCRFEVDREVSRVKVLLM